MGKKKEKDQAKTKPKKVLENELKLTKEQKKEKESLIKSKNIKKKVPIAAKEESEDNESQNISSHLHLSDSDDDDEPKEYPTRSRVPILPVVQNEKMLSQAGKSQLVNESESEQSKIQSSSEELSEELQSLISQVFNPPKKGDEKKKKKKKPFYADYLDVQASESENDEENESQSEISMKQGRARAFFEKQYGIHEDKPLEAYLKKLHIMKDEQINQMYQRKAEEMQEEQSRPQMGNVMTDSYLYSNLYQMSCRKGTEQETVINMLNKAAYCYNNPKSGIPWKIFSVLCQKKRYPGLIFIEAQTQDDIRESVRGFQGIRIWSIEKIQYQSFTSLFSDKKKSQETFNVGDYVIISTGVYHDDLGRVYKVTNNEAIVEVIPRINFQELNKKLEYMDQRAGKRFNPEQLARGKSMIFKEFINPKPEYMKGIQRGKKKILHPGDLEPYKNLQSFRSLSVTTKGFLLHKFKFDDLKLPTTQITEDKLLFLNEDGIDDKKRIKMNLDVQNGDQVEIIQGQLEGLVGLVVEKGVKAVRIKCTSGELKGMVVDEISDYVEKRFNIGETVCVVGGAYKGAQGIILENHQTVVMIRLTDNQSVSISKRNVFIKALMPQMAMQNQTFYVDDIVEQKGSNSFGIIVKTYRNYVQYVSNTNELIAANNDNVTRIKEKRDKRGLKVLHLDYMTKGCMALIEVGPKMNCKMKVKQVIKGYAFLLDQDRLKKGINYGIWVQKASHCSVYKTNTPKIEAQSLKDEINKNITGKRDFKVKALDMEAWQRENIAIGKEFVMKDTSYIGRKGYITKVYGKFFEVNIRGKVFKLEIQKEKDRQKKASEQQSVREDQDRGNEAGSCHGSPLSVVSAATPVRNPQPSMSPVSNGSIVGRSPSYGQSFEEQGMRDISQPRDMEENYQF